jgi:Protein of unknown function (DUF3631)
MTETNDKIAAQIVDEAVAQARAANPYTGSGADLLDRVRAVIARYVVLPDAHAYIAVSLWIAATHGQRAWQTAPRLAINSPEKRCGKSRLLDIIEALAYRPLMAFNATIAALFRSIDGTDPPTLLFDEIDAIFSKKAAGDGSEELRALINSGHGRGRPAIRCVGPLQVPTEFPSFAMAALAGIGDCLPDTITDRSVRVTMRRRAPGEKVDQFRHRRDAMPLRDLGAELNSWVMGHIDELTEAAPVMPVEDRAADTWEPLVAIADLAGGQWPQLARTAAVVMCAEADEGDASLGIRLLGDCRNVFSAHGDAVISSEELVRRLRAIDEAPWESFEFNQRDLSRRLRNYGVRPDRVRPDGDVKQVRGYRLVDFVDAFTRYLSTPVAPAPPSQPVTASQAQVNPVTDRKPDPSQPVTDTRATDNGHGLDNGRVTLCDGSPNGSVTALTSQCDGKTDCDAPPDADAIDHALSALAVAGMGFRDAPTAPSEGSSK